MPSPLNFGPILIPLIYILASVYLYSWFVRMLRPSAYSRGIIRLALLVLVSAFTAGKILGRYDFSSFSHYLSFFSASWMGATLFFAMLAAGVDFVLFLLQKIFLGGSRFHSLAFRRTLFSLISGLVLIAAGYGLLEARDIKVTRIDLPLRRLPPELDGLTLVQVSDIHYGLIAENGRLYTIVNQINELHPDVVVMTGDLVDEGVSHMEQMAEPLTHLKSRLGVFAVTGNHEYYAGVNRIVAIMQQAGIRVLRNEKAVLPGGLQLVGIDDPLGCLRAGAPVPDYNKIISTVNADQPSILLYHQPQNFEKAAAHGIGLQLSGHTHGAQIVPIRPIARMIYPRLRGLFCAEESFLYVSRGAGTGGPPMRLGSPPEIVLIHLHSPQIG